MPAGIQDPAWRGDAPVPSGPPEGSDDSPRANWPRMLNLDDETEERLSIFLDEEIRRARYEKQDLIEDWKDWQADYWATPAEEEKNFPFKRAANIIIPLTAIATEAVIARIMNTIFAVEPFWSVRPQSRQWVEAAKPVEEFLETERKNTSALDVYGMAQDSLTELVKLGTAIGKSSYERDMRKSVRQMPDGSEETLWHERHNGATLDYVPVANFLMRMSEQDPQEARWCGEEHEFTWSQLKRMSLSGRMDAEAIESIKSWYVQGVSEEGGREYQEELDEEVKTEPLWSETFDVQEVWASFDVDGDGIDEEIVIDYHYRSGTILSIRYNWYDDLHRPYRIAQYVKVEGRWPGIGVAKQNEQFQQEVTTVHRQRLDNATLANMRMIAIKKSSGYGPGEPIFPGKMWFVDDTDDIEPLQMSEVYQSAIINEEQLVRYSDKRTGVNEVLLGMPQEGTPGTATGDLARIAEGNKRFDLVLKNVRRWFSLLGRDVLANYQQFGAQRRHFLIHDPEEAEWVERVLEMPGTLVADGAIVELTATDSTVNRQVEQQQWMSVHQVLTNYFSQVLELGQLMIQLGLMDQQQYGRLASRALAAADEATKRLLETFNVQDAEKLLFLSKQGQGGLDGDGQGGVNRLLGQPAAGGGGVVPESNGQTGLGGLGGRLEGTGSDPNRGNGRGQGANQGVRGSQQG